MTDYLIWWTNQSDVERVEYLGLDGQLGHWQKYLKDEFASRNGRAGRGRLWMPDEFTDAPQEAEFGPTNPVCRMAADCGGIVIRDGDFEQVCHLPGFVTTFSMKIVRRP